MLVRAAFIKNRAAPQGKRTQKPGQHARPAAQRRRTAARLGRDRADGNWDVLPERGGAHPKEDDDWWLDLYVMLSRATRLEDLLLMRAPDLNFFTKGPPKTLRTQLAKFASRTNACRKQAEKIAEELGARSLRSSRMTKEHEAAKGLSCGSSSENRFVRYPRTPRPRRMRKIKLKKRTESNDKRT